MYTYYSESRDIVYDYSRMTVLLGSIYRMSRVMVRRCNPLNNSKGPIKTCYDLQTRFSGRRYTIQDISRKMRFTRCSRLQDERARPLVRVLFFFSCCRGQFAMAPRSSIYEFFNVRVTRQLSPAARRCFSSLPRPPTCKSA